MDKKDKFKITKEEQRKMARAASRQLAKEKGRLIQTGTGAHKGTKRDIEEDLSNTVSAQELEELMEEENYNED